MKSKSRIEREIKILKDQLRNDRLDNVIRTIAYDRIEALKWVLKDERD